MARNGRIGITQSVQYTDQNEPAALAHLASASAKQPAPCRPVLAPLSRRHFLALGGMSALAACGLPQQGPGKIAVVAGASALNYVLIDVDERAVRLLGQAPRGSLSSIRADAAAAPTNAVGIGDILHIRVLEAGAGGLFATGDGGAGGTDFPAIVVDRTGQINLPYVGDIKVLGDTPTQIQTKIVARLAGKAIEPQALVTVAQSSNNRATVAGDVGAPGPFALSLSGSRLSQAIAASGGSRFPAIETRVTVVRNGRTGSAYLNDILLKPANDIALQRDDLIVLTREPARYTLTGSVQRPGTFDLASAEYSLLEAISAAGGPSDNRADPGGVFLFRYESPARLALMGKTDLGTYPQTVDGIPTVYRFDLGNPQAQFFAQSFQLIDKDALYVAGAGSVQLTKLLNLFDLGLRARVRADAL